MLTHDELSRYNRHILIPEIGEEGQEKLKQAKVLIIGAGGLGSAASIYLVASGIGYVTLMDGDSVDLSNLQRQTLYSHHDIGKLKVDAAHTRLAQQNTFIKIETISENFSVDNADIVENYDLVISALDNSLTRYLVNDVCVRYQKPFIHASVKNFEGQLAVFNYKEGPTYRDLFPEKPLADFFTPADKGVLAPLPGIMGCLQAAEAIKIITGVGEVLSGKLLIINLLNSSFRVLTLS